MRCALVLAAIVAVLLSAPDAWTDEPADRSLTPEAYLDLGVPAPDRLWTAKDHAAAAAALKKIAAEDPGKLPRRGGARSGAVWARIASAENLEPFASERLPAAARMGLLPELMPVVNELLVVYFNASIEDATFNPEVIDLFALMLRTATIQLRVADAFAATLPADDPVREVRLEGLAKLRKGTADMFGGVIVSLDASAGYAPPDRRRLAAVLAETLPDANPRLPPLTAKEMPARIARMVEVEGDLEVRSTLERLAKALR